MAAFQHFSRCSRLEVNLDKSLMVIARIEKDMGRTATANYTIWRKQCTFQILRCASDSQKTNQIGLSHFGGFDNCKDKGMVCEKMVSYRKDATNQLSFIEYVYMLGQIFLLHKYVLDKISQWCTSFLWNFDTKHRRPALVCWADICKLKKEVGMGVKDCFHLNNALVTKLVWHLANGTESLRIGGWIIITSKGNLFGCAHLFKDSWH